MPHVAFQKTIFRKYQKVSGVLVTVTRDNASVNGRVVTKDSKIIRRQSLQAIDIAAGKPIDMESGDVTADAAGMWLRAKLPVVPEVCGIAPKQRAVH